MVRRPLLYAVASMASSILIFQYFGNAAAVAVLLLLACCYFFGKKSPDKGSLKITIIFFCYLVGSLNMWMYKEAEDPLMKAAGQRVVGEGRVISSQQLQSSRGDIYVKYILKMSSINGNSVDSGEKLMVWDYSGGKIEPGDRAEAEGIVELPEKRRNPRCFDYSLYLESIGIRAVMKDADTKIIHKGSGLTAFLYHKKEAFDDNLGKVAGRETAEVLNGIMFGDKAGIEEETLEEFQKNGTAHILAVSGLHVGIIYGFISFIWPWKKNWLFFTGVSIFFIMYTIMAAFAPSVIRAVFMVEMHIFAKLTGRRYDLSSAAFAIALIMMLRNPMQIFHVGFQMSFVAVLSLSLLLPYIKKIHSGALAGGLAIQAGLTPLTVFSFNYLSVAGIFVNILVIFMAGIIVPLGLAAFLLMDVNESLFTIAGRILFYICSLLEDLNHAVCIDGLTVFKVVSPPVALMACYYLMLIVLLSEEGRLMILRREKKRIILAGILIIILSAALGFGCRTGFEKADIVFVDVGPGDCIHFKTEAGGNYMVDGGGKADYNVGKKILKPYLLKNGVGKLNGAFVTHLHTDHYQGIKELCRENMVERLFLYEGNRVWEKKILEETGMKSSEITYLAAGERISLGENEFVDILWPERGRVADNREMADKEADENETSLIMKISIRGVTTLVTGDVDQACQEGLAKEWRSDLKADILKVSHHGSKYSYSREFNDFTQPGYAVFQVGRNSFGHPNRQVIDRYREKGAYILRNDIHGAIGFQIDDRTFGLKKPVKSI